MVYAVQPSNYFAYGSIIIDRDQIVSLTASSATLNYRSERVVFPTNIINNGNEIDRIQMVLKLTELELIPWLNYYQNAPTNLQQDIKLGVWTSNQYAIESINFKYIDFVPLGNNTYQINYEATINFIRSL